MSTAPSNMTLAEYRESAIYAETMRRCIDSIGFFMDKISPHARTVKPAGVHADFERLATDLSLKHGVIEVYRDSAKSTYFAITLPLWHRFCEPFLRAGIYPATFEETQAVLRSTDAVTFSVINSKTQKEAKRRLRTIGKALGARPSQKKEVLEGRRNFRILFGDWAPRVESSTTEELRLKDGTLWIAMGMDQQGHGLNEDFVRPTLVINDDPESEVNTKTPDALGANFDKFMNGLYAGLSGRGRAYSLATPIVDGCMIRQLRDLSAKMPGWEHIHRPVLREENGRFVSDWPDRPMFQVGALMAEKEGLASDGKVYLWYQKRQCEIKGRENQLFSEDDIMLYDGDLVESAAGKPYLRITHMGPYAKKHEGSPFALPEPEIVPVNLFGGHDPAEGVGGDNAVFGVIAYDGTGKTRFSGRRFLVEYTSDNTTSTPGQCDWIMNAHERINIMHTTVEGSGFERVFRKELQEQKEEREIWPVIKKKVPRDSKDVRYVSDMVGSFERHRWFFKRTHMAAIDELLLFRASRKHNKDDHIDMLWLASRNNHKPTHTAADFDDSGSDARDDLPWYLQGRSPYDTRKDWQVN